MHGGDGLEYLDCEGIETIATCTVGFGQGKERKEKQAWRSIMLRSLSHEHTRNPFPQRFSWLAQKKSYRYYYWWYKKVHFRVQTGASSSRLHAHTKHLEPSSLHFAQLKITRHNADCTSTRQSVVQMPENNAENNAEEGEWEFGLPFISD